MIHCPSPGSISTSPWESCTPLARREHPNVSFIGLGYKKALFFFFFFFIKIVTYLFLCVLKKKKRVGWSCPTRRLCYIMIGLGMIVFYNIQLYVTLPPVPHPLTHPLLGRVDHVPLLPCKYGHWSSHNPLRRFSIRAQSTRLSKISRGPKVASLLCFPNLPN